MSYKGIAWGLVLLALVIGLSSCGGGGGGGGGDGLTVSGSNFGYFNTFGNTSSAPSTNDYPKLWGINLPIIMYFNEEIDPNSCNNLSINLVTIDDPLGKADYGAGHSATVDHHVFGSELWIKPRMFFSQTEVTFGFLANALYEISFQVPPSPNVVRSITGRPITVSGEKLAFRTPAIDDPDGYIYDEAAGPPEPIGFTLLDSTQQEIANWTGGTWYQSGQPVTKVEVDPMTPPGIRIDFNELVQPTTVVNFADKSSPSLSVFYNFQGLPWDPVNSLGEWTLYQSVTGPQTTETYAEFDFDLIALASDTEYFIDVKGIVEDLAGNSKGYSHSDQVSFFTTNNTQPLPPLVEEFDTTAYEDPSGTSASWSRDIGGGEFALVPGTGGGTGGDGVFLPPDNLPHDAWLTAAQNKVGLPVAKANGEPRIYNFTSFTLPPGWRLYPVDVNNEDGYPLVIKATGTIKVLGTISVAQEDDGFGNGKDGDYGDFKFGTAGGLPICGGGKGGQGGGCHNGMSSPFKSVTGYEGTHANFGITGVSTDLQDYRLQDSNISQADFEKIKDALDLGYPLYLQPNVGMGPGNSNVVMNHPTFFVKEVNPTYRIISIVDDPQDPNYRGSMLQASTNPGIPVPPIAKVGDAYLVGSLKGGVGADPADMGRAGRGGDPLTVAQTLTTLATAGAGGGGGGLEAAVEGATGPDFEPAGVAIGGFSRPYSLGGLGGAESGPSGIVIGPSSSNPKYDLEVADVLGTTDYSGYRVNPSRDEGGWLFPIVSNDNNTITVASVSSDVEVFDLTSIVFDGDEIFQILPPEDMGGAGGGGSGVGLTGTTKNVFSPPYQLPGWICGAGGGAGGGVIKLETASSISVAATGSIIAEGGQGGTINGPGALSIPGGGGGSGGNILLRARDEIKFSTNAVVSVLGGEGGGTGVLGGQGGHGLIRLENSANNITPGNYGLTTYPPVTEFNCGMFPAQEGTSLAHSKFYFMGISKPDYIYDPNNPDEDLRGLKIVYDMLEIDHLQQETLYEDLVYPDPTGPFPTPMLYRVFFNSCPADFDGFIDLNKITNTYVEYSDFDTMDGNPYVRFKLQLISLREVQQGGNTYTYRNLKIKSISINRSQQQ